MPAFSPSGPARPSRQAQSALTSQDYDRESPEVKRPIRSQTLSLTRKPLIQRDAALWDAFVRPEEFAWSIGDDGVVIVRGGAA
jgi:hypothetical protein